MSKKNLCVAILCVGFLLCNIFSVQLSAKEAQEHLPERKVVIFHDSLSADLFFHRAKELFEDMPHEVTFFNEFNAISLPLTNEINHLLFDFSKKFYLLDNMIFSSYPIADMEYASRLTEENWNLELTGAPLLWEKGYTGKGVKVAILDTGLDGRHEAFRGRVVDFAEFGSSGAVYRSDPGSAYDTQYHGTHVAGIALGSSPHHPLGVAPQALISAGVVIPRGGGTMSQIIGGLEWCLDPDGDPETNDQPRIVNLSLGMPGFIKVWTPIFEKLLQKNILPIAAIGNEGDGICGSPGSTPNVFSVGAVDKNLQPAWFSSGGDHLIWEDSHISRTMFVKPEITAPGVAIFSAIPGNMYAWLSGTSMSSPHVAGAAALLMEAFPLASALDIWHSLIQGANQQGHATHNSRFGAGTLDLMGSYEYLKMSHPLEGSIEGNFKDCVIINRKFDLPVYIDSEGSFSCLLPPGAYNFDVFYKGAFLQTFHVTASNKDQTIQLKVPSVEEVMFRGVIHDSSGRPLSATLSNASKRWKTDDEGRFSIQVETPDEILIRSSGYVEIKVQITKNQQYHNIRLKKADLLLIEGYSMYLTSVNPPRIARNYYLESLQILGKNVAFIDAENENYTYDEIKDYPLILYFCESGAIDRQEYPIFSRYINQGGRMIFSGRMLLHLENQTRQLFLGSMFGVSGREFLIFPSVEGLNDQKDVAGLSFSLSGDQGANNQETCDIMLMPSTVNYVQPFLRFTDTSGARYAGVRRADNISKTVLLTFGIEGIGLPSMRTELIGKLLDWMEDSRSLHIEVPEGETFYLTMNEEASKLHTIETDLGLFRLTNILPELYSFKIEGFGYQPYSFTIDFSELDFYNIRLRPNKAQHYHVFFDFEATTASNGFYRLYYKSKLIQAETCSFKDALSFELPSGDYRVIFSAKRSNHLIKEFSVEREDQVISAEIKTGEQQVLIVDNSKMGIQFRDTLRLQEEYSKLLHTFGIRYDIWDITSKDFPSFYDLVPYELVIYLTGTNVFSFEKIEIFSTLASYLDHQGSVAFMGNSAYLSLRGQSFLSEYIGVSVSSSNTRERTVFTSGNSWFENMSFDLYTPFNEGFPRFPSFEPTNQQVRPVFFYANSNRISSIVHQHSQYTVAFFSFGAENIIIPSVRQEFMKGVLKIFGYES